MLAVLMMAGPSRTQTNPGPLAPAPTPAYRHGAANPLNRETSSATAYYTASKWQALERRAAAAHAAAANKPLQEPADRKAREEFDRGKDLYQHGDPAGAAKWFSKCAERGDQYCQLQLGYQYEAGQGVRPDLAEATRLYTAAAKSGDAQAQVNLGNFYAQGKGVARDDREAVRWFAAAASQGNPDGLYSFARAYEFGLGVPRDRARAVALYESAAEHGDVRSVEAARWLSDPTNLSFPDERARDAYLAQLQDAEAQWHGCQARADYQRRLGFHVPICVQRWVNPNTW